MQPALYLGSPNPRPEDFSLPCGHRNFKKDVSFFNASHVWLPLDFNAWRDCSSVAAEDKKEQGSARYVCQLHYFGRNKPGEPQITQGGGSPKWNKFPDSHYLTALWERGPPLTGYWRERLSPCPTASQGDCQAAEARAAQPAPWSGPGGNRPDRESAKFREGLCWGL